MLPIRKTRHFLEFNFSPEILLKLSKISTSVSNDLSEPSRIKMRRREKRLFIFIICITNVFYVFILMKVIQYI